MARWDVVKEVTLLLSRWEHFPLFVQNGEKFWVVNFMMAAIVLFCFAFCHPHP